MLFDIRHPQNAAQTLEHLTGVKAVFWEIERIKNSTRIDYTDSDKDIIKIINTYGGHLPQLEDIELVISHITTSSNYCSSILEYGLVDLKKAYNLPTSELRIFLNNNNIEISTDDCLLYHGADCYNISYGARSISNSAAREVGRKFYYDFTICGFLSINERDTYLGLVHKRPEILHDIDKLLNTSLQNRWINSHKAYEIVFSISEYDTVYNGWDDDSEYDKIMYYLTSAYECVCLGPRTTEILCRNNIEIKPEQILECNEFKLWK